MRVVVTWTGGKDCCLSCYEAISKGHEVSTLLNFEFTDTENRTPFKFSNLLSFVFKDIGKSTPYRASILMNFAFEAVQRRSPRGVSVAIKKLLKTLERHGPRQISNLLTLMVKNESKMIWHQLPRDVIALQAEAMEIPIIQKKTTWGMFEDNIKSAMRSLKREDAEGMVWGIRPPDEALLDDSKKLGDYVHLRAEKEWVFKVCGDLGVEPILPLWEKSPEQVLTELMEKGFEVLVVVVNPDYFGDEWLGRRIDESFLTLIRRLHRDEGVPVGGDDYHTLVVDGPLFKKRLHILESKTVIKNGYQILDVTKAELVAKS